MIVVTGASGNVGRPLVRALTARGEQVRVVARGITLGLEELEGVSVVRGDLSDPGSLSSALQGAEALFLLVPGAGAGLNIERLLELAAAGGVQRVTLLSSQAAGTRPTSSSHAPLAAIEHLVRSSGLAWTILRPSGFHSNALAWAPTIRDQQTVYAPFGDIGLPSIDPADIAEVAAVTLTDEGHDQGVYVLTGPEITTPRDRVAAIGAALGESIELVELTRAQALEQLALFMPPPVADGTLDILGEPTPEEVTVSQHVAMVLGRPGRPFGDWAVRNADLFR